jgi:hypothetical protein
VHGGLQELAWDVLIADAARSPGHRSVPCRRPPVAGRLDIGQPQRGTVDASLHLIDDLDRQTDTSTSTCGRPVPTIPLSRCC